MRSRTLVATAAVLALAATSPAQEESRRDRPVPSVTVTGTGEARGRPDIARVQVGVVTQADTAATALEQNSAATERLIAALKRQGIDEKDIRTVRIGLSPRYEHDPQGRRSPEVVGYEAVNEVQVTVRDLSALGKTLDEVVRAGANRIDGISFEIEDRRQLLDEARRKAVEHARHAAETYATAAGIRLGRVLSIQEQGAGGPEPYPQPRYLGIAAAERAVPVSPGEQTVSVNVTVRYGIEPGRGERGRTPQNDPGVRP